MWRKTWDNLSGDWDGLESINGGKTNSVQEASETQQGQSQRGKSPGEAHPAGDNGGMAWHLRLL